MWEPDTEGLVLLKQPESGHCLGTGFLQARGLQGGAGWIRLKGPCAWPFKGTPTPVGGELSAQELPRAADSEHRVLPRGASCPLPLALSELMLRCHGCMSSSDHVPSGTVQDSLLFRMIPSLRSKIGALFRPFLLDPAWTETRSCMGADLFVMRETLSLVRPFVTGLCLSAAVTVGSRASKLGPVRLKLCLGEWDYLALRRPLRSQPSGFPASHQTRRQSPLAEGDLAIL